MPGARSARGGGGARAGLEGRSAGRKRSARARASGAADGTAAGGTDPDDGAAAGDRPEGVAGSGVEARTSGGDRADGRVLRGLRNRDAVVESFISLIEEGDPRPTARSIAGRAGLSLRSVFQHFDDLEQIYEVAGRRQVRKLRPLLEPVPATGPLDARLDEFLRRRVALLEQLDPVARAARLREPFSAQLRSNRASVVTVMRQQVQEVFAPELEAARRGPGGVEDSTQILAALATAASWATWYHLRNDQELPVDDAAPVLRRLLRGVLADAGARLDPLLPDPVAAT